MSLKREQLITTAIELFQTNGFHATGIDTILKESGIAKKTLYNHFRSKEELIIAALRRYDSEFRNQFMRQVESAADAPKDKLLAVFDVAGKWFAQNNFFGCMFINAIGEYAELDTSIRNVCKEYKSLMHQYLQQLSDQAGAKSPEELADELFLLLEGATVIAQVSQKKNVAKTAKRVASALIEDAIG